MIDHSGDDMNEKQVTLQLNINQLNTVLAAVVKLPIDVGLDVFNLIQQQAQAQLNTAPAAAPAEQPAAE